MNRSIILIHGAWHDASCFDPVRDQLVAQGYEVATIDLPLAGSEGDIEAASKLIAAHPGAVVLGHSYGGLVITHAAVSADVTHLVYLAALMPDQGEDVGAVVGEYPSPDLQNAMVLNDDGRLTIDPERGIIAFYDDCDPADAQQAAERLRPQLFTGFPILEAEPAWKQTASTYVICNHDRAQHPDLQRRFAERATHVETWEGGHSPFLSQPSQVTELLARLARA